MTRTTTTRYDGAGLTTATWAEVAGLPGSTARTSTTYDAWGRVLTSTNDLGDVTTTSYVPPGTPGAGSVASVTDTMGTTSYGYDGTDAAGKAEARGLTTTQTITRPSPSGGSGDPLVFTAAYDADGKMTVQKLPGQLTQTTSYDEAGEPVALTYSGTVQPVKQRLDGAGQPVTDPVTGDPVYDPDGPALPDQPWLAWTTVNDAQGRVTNEATGPSAGFDGNPGVTRPGDITGYDVGQAAGYDRSYAYDGAGRLTQVADTTAATARADLTTSACVVRAYGFDDNGRRTTLTSTVHGDGNCTGTTNTTTTSTDSNSYDSADRPTQGQDGAGQYVYDALGRQTTIPAADTPAYATDTTAGDITLAYYDDDQARTITQTLAGQTTSTTFTLDSSGRRSTATISVSSSGAPTATSSLVRHYSDGSDNPAWTVATDPTGQTSTTRYAESIGADLGATINTDGSTALTLAGPRGDIVTTVPLPTTSTDPAAGINGWADYTEYGAPRTGSTPAATAGTVGYGWLGAKQRSTTTETAGLTLMGARLYNQATGTFTSPDPQPGGNTTAYTYPTDPINMFDLDGRRRCRSGWRGGACRARHWTAGRGRGAYRWLKRYDYGSAAAAGVNMAYGGYKLARGITLLRAIPVCAAFGVAAACGAVGGYNTVAGSLRLARGAQQGWQFAHHRRCHRDCGVRGNARRFRRGVLPRWSGRFLDKVGWLP